MIAVLIALLLVPSFAQATVYWADSAGNNAANCTDIDSAGTSAAPGSDPGSYGTIGRAAACASTAGDVVNIKAGTYTGTNHKITSGAMFASGSSDSVRTIIQGNPGGAVPQINIPNWFTTDESSGTHRNYFTIQDVSISGTGGADGGGCEIGIEGAYILVQRVTITNSYNMNICSFTGTSASANNHDHVVKYNSLQNAGSGDGCGYGIYSNASNVTFEHNEVFGGKCGGAQIYADDFAVNNSIIRYNYFHDIAKSTQVSALNYCFGIAVNGANAQVYNNIIDGGGCGGGSSAAYGIGHFGQTGAYLLAYNNLIINWASEAIQVGLGAAGAGGNIERNNIMYGNGGTIGVYNSTGNTASHNACASGCAVTISALTDCTVSTVNFTHKSGSSCVDAGTTVATVTDDYIGTARPQGSVYDIGPYEQVASSSGGMTTTPAWDTPRRFHLWRR